MKFSKRCRRYSAIFALSVACVIAFAWIFTIGQQPISAEKNVQDSWNLMQEVGQYDFSATIEQVTYPAPALANVGRSSTKEIYQVSGQADLHNNAMNVRLFQNKGSLLNPGDGVEIRVQNDLVSGRLIGSTEWEPLEDVSSTSYLLGNNGSSYLSAARNVRVQGDQVVSLPGKDGSTTAFTVTRYRFDVDPDKYAVWMRDQMVAELQRSGKLPLGMNLSVSEAYRQMVSSGELWVNSSGLPVRMVVSMKMPQDKTGDHIEASITTDYYNHQTGNLLAAQPIPYQIAGALGLPTNGQAAGKLLTQISLAAGCAALLMLVAAYSQKKFVYATVAALTIFSMLFSPLWRSEKSAVLAKEIQSQEPAARNEPAAENPAVEPGQYQVWDAHANPLNTIGAGASAEQLAALEPQTRYSLVESLNVFSPAPQVSETGESDVDTDQDGLTDAYESQYSISVLDPNKTDTDDDGLNDAVELLLNLFPGERDTDGDGIWDNDEVRPINTGDQDWYMNPEERDTDLDGQIDGSECPQRINGNSAGVCQDTDGDGTPDVFDSDDDQDGVPTVNDESPYVVTEQTYSQQSPLQLSVTNLDAKPVFINYQVVPTNEKHLTYALNVLDWPSGDTDGQIQRISDTAFSNHMTSGQAAADPRSQYGDMRLIPMVEIKLIGDSYPLPLTRAVSVEVTGDDYTGSFEFSSLEDQPGKTLVKMTGGETTTQAIKLGAGTCDEFTLVSSLDVHAVNDAVLVDQPLGNLVNGEYVLFATDTAGELSACSLIPVVAHGKLTEYVIDSTLLQAYGGAARDDGAGNILLYAPLSVVYDETGGKPAAFSARIPFTNIYGGFASSQQEVRVVWMINMLTDECQALPAGYDESASGTWCTASLSEHWNKDTSRVVHTYTDSFKLAGLSVEEDHGVEMAVIFENPATDPHPEYDDPLWGMSSALERTFLAGRSADGENLDITIDEIQRRFDPNQNPGIIDMNELWGFEKDTFRVATYWYDSADGVSAFINGQAAELFNTYFESLPVESRPSSTNLLFARQVSQRATSIGESAASCSGATCTVDFSGLAVFVQAVMNWAPYQRQEDGWDTYALDDYIDNLEAHLRSLDSYQPADDSTDARNTVDGQIALAKIYYQSLFNGAAMLVAVNGVPLINVPAVVNDEDIFTTFHGYVGTGSIVTKVLTAVVSTMLTGFEKNPRLLFTAVFGSKMDTVSSVFKAIGKGAADKASPITKLLTNNLRKVALGAAVFVIVAGLAVAAVLYLNGENTSEGRWAGRILFAAIGTLSAVLAGAALSTAIKTMKCVSYSAKVAAVIGAVIGAIITWGIFFYTWGSTGMSFGSLAFNNTLAEAIAATATIVLLAALACTGVGAIIVAVIALIDALIMTICSLAGANDQDEDHWARQYVCIGISGWITKVFKWVLYSNTYLIDYENGKRLLFTGVDQDLEDLSAGMTYGNHMRITVGVKNTITKSSVPVDWKAAAYFWQYSDHNAKTSTFTYKLQSAEGDVHGSLSRGDMTGDWESLGSSKWVHEFSAATDGYSIPVPQAGINQDPTVYISEGSALPVQECWAIFIPGITPVPIPICYIRTEKATVNSEVSSSLTVDSFPADLDAFYSLVADDSLATGWKLSWAQSGDVKFPVLRDADGDGLLSKSYPGGNDPDDQNYDTDADGLNDSYEMANGTNPRMMDSDDDGLSDAMEILRMTSPTRKDTDGDGLTDYEEVMGWLYTYAFTAIGAPLETMVYPDPLIADTDMDGVTDYLEKVYGFNPRVSQDSDVLEYELAMLEQDSPMVMLRFDESSGSTVFADSSNYGFMASCTAAECPVGGVDGRYGAAVRFDGTDLLRLPTSAKSISLTDNRPFTLAGWVNYTAGGALFAKWSDAESSQQELRFEITGDQRLQLVSPLATIASSAAVPTDRWTHVAVSFDGSQATFLIDGNIVGVSSFSTGPAAPDSQTEILLGAYQGASDLTGFYQGALDEMTYFDHALSADDLATRWMAARYNFNDSYVRPGEEVIYQSKITNLLNSRFAYGLLTTLIDKTGAIVDWLSKIIPTTFVLYPSNPVEATANTAVLQTPLQIEPGHSVSENVTITQTASAQIVDRRSESNLAELWLPFEEAGGAATFVDSSGSMPSRNVTCTDCPISNQNGILNKAVLFQQGQTDRIGLPDLSTLDLLNHGYTLSMWLKPANTVATGSSIPVLGSDSDRLSVNLVQQADGSYLPEVRVNNTNVVSATSWRTIKAAVWSHLVVEYFSADGALKVYINGGQIAQTNADALTTNAAFWLGGSTAPAGLYVDDLRIFSRPLTVTDINRLAERPVLALNMDSASFADTSVYNQSVTIPHNQPGLSNESVRGSSLNPGSGSGLGFIQVNGNSLLDMSDGSFTFSVWVYPTSQSNPTWQGIFGYREDGAQAYPSLERQGSRLRFGFGDGSAYQSHTTADILTQSKWSLVTVTFAPSQFDSGSYTFKLYIDSVLKESRSFTSKPVSRSAFYVGTTSRSFTTSIFRLNMDDEHDAGSNAEPYIEEYINGSHTSNPMGEASMGDGDHRDINYSKTLSGADRIEITVWEEDSTSGDDNCGSFTRYWYNLPDVGVQTLGLSDGFDGSLTYQMTKPSIEFYGRIDELQVYRYALDSEQVYDLFYAIPVTARLPLNDRPSSTSFENNAFVGSIDDGTCSGAACPAAGTIGLINQATRFDGVDDVITVPVTTTSNYMVSLWLNSTCENCGVFSLKNGASVYHQLYLKSGNICSLVGSTEMCSRGSTVNNGQWHYVVYSNNGSSANLWLDGAVVNTLAGTGAVASPGTSAQLGYAPQAQNPTLNGQLDDVRVFRYTQNETVIAEIQQRAPIFLAHLDEPDGSSLFDDATPNDFQLGCSGDGCPTGDSEGRLGQSVEFNQISDGLSLNQAGFSSTATAFSASLWIYPTQNKPASQSILTILNGANAQPRYAISIAPDSMYLTVQNAENIPVDTIPRSQVALIKNTWNMVTLVVERNASNTGENIFLYINGYLDSSWASSTYSAGLGKIILGNSAGFAGLQSGPYSGRIDEVAIYEHTLNEIDIRETFAYQMGQVEETSSLTMTIDADLPEAALISYNPDFLYMDEKDRVLHVEASDATSGIGMVEMQVEHINAPSVEWAVAPICQDGSGGTAFCPTFIPRYGDGNYTLVFRAVDRVGNQSSTASYSLLVDNRAPNIFVNLQNGSLYNAEAHQQLKNTWFLHMEGQVFDETLSQGPAGSGLDLSSMMVTIYSENGEKIGAGEQAPHFVAATNGYDWNLDYLFPESEPTGAVTVVIEAKDRVGNLASRSISILLDASAPGALMQSNITPVGDSLSLLDAATLPGKLISGGSVGGSAQDVPEDDIPYMTENGKQAASGVSRVEAAFESSLGVSYIYNEPYPDGLLAWLPLDNAKLPEDAAGNPSESAAERYFMDISPFQFSGVCSGAGCPINGETGHRNGSIYFDGQDRFISLGAQVDLANRSFSTLIWARRDAAGHGDPFLWQGPLSMAGQRFLFGLDYDNHVVCGFGGGDLLTVDSFTDTDWHAYACTFDASSGARVIYRDGQVVASDAAAPVPVMSEDLLIGYAPIGSFAGSLDELLVLDHALTADEVREAYTGYQTVYHLSVQEKFLANADTVADESGFFQTGSLLTGEGDLVNKVTAGAVGEYALRFDGSDRVAVTPAYSLLLDRGEFTQTAWIKPAGGSGLSGIISEFDENPEQRYPSIYLTDQFALIAGFGDYYDWYELRTDGPVVQPGAWNFIAARFDGATYSLFVNGQVVAQTNAIEGKKPYPASRFNIGEGYTGDIDDVKVFTRPLSDLEIAALASSGWRDARLNASEAGLNWSANVLPGLEGSYRIDVRAWDQFGHFGAGWDVDHQWSGVVDTIAPRFSFQRSIDPNDPYLAHYTFSVEDALLDENSIHQNLCDEMDVTREYFNSSWYLATGAPPNTTLYRLSGTCSGDIRSRATTGFYACDLAGNCVMEEYQAYLPEAIYLPFVAGAGSSGVPTLIAAPVSSGVSAEDKERAMQWAVLADSVTRADGGQSPEIEIWTDELTQADARSLFHANIKGVVSDDGTIESVQVEILQNGALVYTTQASVYHGLWNAAWVYAPGGQPANGAYTVRVTATDAAGNQTSAEHNILVHLLP